ncbi:UNVERIFIED_CONTAM: Lamin-like protein [Sesamum calycinum]|uniref:Lamin-like protein n=1 Tax=Sesamum calycinum TaxID=2727403 RepID=A0AAW2Q3U6_9LAMI
MASKAFLITIIVATIAAAPPAFATDYVVGDESGWTLGVNYTAWAEGKEFYVGDRLINGTAFQQCTVPPPSEALSSGSDVITLAAAGRKWYICGVGNHCASGMKLVITVASSVAPASAPAPGPTSGGPLTHNKKPMNFWSNWKLKINF